MSMGGHQSAAAMSTTWLTPQPIIDALGGWQSFDLDPCAAPMPRPWFTAWHHNAESDGDGLGLDWFGRVWLNMPYDNVEAWLRKLADHGQGTALVFARTETEPFRRQVWERATGLLFLHGRLFFHHADGTRARHNGGAPSVLCAYGQDDLDRLAASDLDGALVPLRFALGSWCRVVIKWNVRKSGSIAWLFRLKVPKRPFVDMKNSAMKLNGLRKNASLS